MNERINELRLEAGISRLHDEPKFMVAVSKEGTVIEPLDGLEKFAELIVRETLNEMGEQMNKFGDDQSNNPTWYKAMEAVGKHFGVKE
jgi:hypothetical protein